MFKVISKFLDWFLGIPDIDPKWIERVNSKQAELSNYGGRMKVIGRGSLIHDFDTKEGERAYWAMIRRRHEQRCREAGYDSIQHLVEESQKRA